MIIVCQNCKAKYKIDENKLKSYLKKKIPCKRCNQPLDFNNQLNTPKISSQFFRQKDNPPMDNEVISRKDESSSEKWEVKWRDSLQFKFSLILCLVMLIILIFHTLINTVTTKKQMTEDLSLLAQRTAMRLSKSLIAPLWEVDETQIHENILSEMMEDNIYGITIRDIDHKKILYGNKRKDDWLIEKTKSSITGDFIYFGKDILKEDELIGTVEVYVTRNFIENKFYREIRNITITSLLLISSIFITTFFTMKKLLIQPIKHLIWAAEKISFGDFNVKIERDAKDEIGDLSRALERMKVSLNLAMHRLKKRN